MSRPAPRTMQSVTLPAPTGGLNTLDGGSAMPDLDCVQLWNMVSGEHGLRTRLGYKSLSEQSARSLIPFVGGAANASGDRLFAMSRTQIVEQQFDVYNTTTIKHTFTIPGPNTGRGVAHAFTTSAGNFLLYADEANGYHVYTESTGAWAEVQAGVGAGQLDGLDPRKACFVMVWKSRVWFVERNTNNAWYLPAGTIFGTAVKLALAQSAQFRHGGDLVGLWNWTLDGGAGVDDLLVAATRGGDVAVYQGSDPASASSFALKGTWHAGALVAGRRVATSFGGDLLLLTKSGLRPLSQLVSGADGGGTYVTAKIANLFNALAEERGHLPGWDVGLHPGENALLVTVPKPGANEEGEHCTEQLVMSLWGTRSWSRFDLPIEAMCVFNKKLYFSARAADVDTEDETNAAWVWCCEGSVDRFRTDIPRSAPILWSVLSAFRNFGSAARKQVQFTRTALIAYSDQPRFNTVAQYDHDLSDRSDIPAGNLWDGGLWDGAHWRTESGLSTWDAAQWDSSTFRDYPYTYRVTRGGSGSGTDIAVATSGYADAPTVLVGVDVAFTQGGPL